MIDILIRLTTSVHSSLLRGEEITEIINLRILSDQILIKVKGMYGNY